MKIVDCFTFYNEFDLLMYRLTVLYDIVDHFVLVESTHTHTGRQKLLYYNENKQMFSRFSDKIIHVIVDDFPHKYPDINFDAGEQWINERFQRDQIGKGIARLTLEGDDVITVTDLDEIPDPNVLSIIKRDAIQFDIYSLEMDMYYYNLNCKVTGELWIHPKIFKYAAYVKLNKLCSELRFHTCPAIKNGGWHLSYFGDARQIQNKIINFSHQEFNQSQFTDIDKINERVSTGTDLYDRSNPIIRIPICDNKYLPVRYNELLTQFYEN